MHLHAVYYVPSFNKLDYILCEEEKGWFMLSMQARGMIHEIAQVIEKYTTKDHTC